MSRGSGNNKKKGDRRKETKTSHFAKENVKSQLRNLKQQAESRKNDPEFEYYTNEKTKKVMKRNAELLYKSQRKTIDDD